MTNFTGQYDIEVKPRKFGLKSAKKGMKTV